MKIKINDHIVDNTTSGLNNNRGLMFGDGFFTTATIKSGALVWGNHHYDRLVNSAERLMFNSFEVKPIQKAVSELCNAHNEAVIRITVYRHQNERGYAISEAASTESNRLRCFIPASAGFTLIGVFAETSSQCSTEDSESLLRSISQ